MNTHLVIIPGMKFHFSSYPSDEDPDYYVDVAATPTGWLVNRYERQSLINSTIVPDKDHLVNPCAFWDHPHGEFIRHEQAPLVPQHQLIAEWVFDMGITTCSPHAILEGGPVEARIIRRLASKEYRASVPLGTPPSFDENILLCPHCRSDYLSHSSIDWYWGKKEDSKKLTVIEVDEDCVNTHEAPRLNSGNPSDRRDGFVISLCCETCEANIHLSFAQHKGQTIVKWEEL